MQSTPSATVLPPKRRRHRWLWISLTAFLLLLIAGFIYAAWPGRSTFTVSPETTYVTGPVDKDGYVDYVTAVNERLRGNIKPEENANVLLWQAIGPHPEGGNTASEHFQWLGAPPPPEQGEYYEDFLKQLAKLDELSHDRRDELDKRMDRATKWPWRAQDEPELANWLNRVEKPLAIVIAASRRPEYFNPMLPKNVDDYSQPRLVGALLPNVQVCRGIAAALACRAMLRVNDGKTEEAWRDLLACHRLGRLVGRGGELIELLVGIALDRIAGQADIAFLDHSKLTSNEIQRCLHDLQQLPPLPPVADKIDLFERFMMLDALMLFAREWPAIDESVGGANRRAKPGFWQKLFTRNVNWDPAFRNVNRWCDRCVAGSRIPDRNARKKEMDAIEAEFKALKPKIGIAFLAQKFMGPKQRGEMIGNILIALLLPAFDKLQTAGERCEQYQRNLHLAFALATYHADHGRYPQALAELAPKYLDQIPDDIFSGKPVIYKPEPNGYLLYSVGANGIDDGGQTLGDDPPGDDLVIRMPVPEPKIKK
jgi:hypothetical protein